MGRSNWRLKYISKSVLFKIIQESVGVKLEDKLAIITDKSSTIPESLIGNIVFIHRGNRLRKFKLSQRHIGFKFGEFILTRRPHIYRKKVKSNRR